MSAGAKAITYPDVIAALRQHGVHVPDNPDARGINVQCPVCSADNPADMSLRVQSRQRNAELHCHNGCDQVRILQAIGFPGVQWADPPPRRQGTEEHSGQVRMAYRLADAYADRLLHVHGIGWHYWDGKRWAFDNCGAAKRAVLDVFAAALAESVTNQPLRQDVAKCESNNGIIGVLGIASALLAATVADLDADPYLLNVANGTYDLRTGELRDHEPRDRITKVTRGAYDPPAPAAAWPRFIGQVLPDEQVRAYLQRVAGLSLLGKVAEHILPILTGTGANGKGTWYGAMLYALGDYAAPADPDLFMAREGAHPTGQMDLRGQRLVVVSESDEGRRLNEGTMKRLTGGDTIKARLMHRDFVEFTPSHTAFLVTNHLPKVSGDDPAVWRRLRVIPFDVVIPPEDRDPHLDEKLQAEADAVLAWAIAGWNAYRDNGDKLAEPPQVLAATGDYQRDSDAVARFIDEECVTSSPVNKITTRELFAAWERWRAADGSEQISEKRFGQALDKKGYPAAKGTGGKRFRAGITLAANATD
ncbi:bacteriophage protein [Mycobacteroides abscessus subsp. abscessus]|uniref:DNA primase family protein n=1 Tax=Mycobacteroides abscessus TaxID=36809 RepID=UPI00092BDACD|nr:phage/plasmid primase, P4 family [Mycobacteroides abscessus]SIJ71277.1 bacteriophage protein [Mycobacteroides abscessus subsp. abscessus]SIL80916.1 bacteriophage protein [Mycobacteroides abscessus subsp. abscessus]SLK93949.1 bacteriophage protein [Mycobacteroides abscessus subsp. abscessus]